MSFEFFVAFRYLLAKRKQAVISLITVISVAGVAAGVMALIIALALNTGFQKEFQKRILGATSHVNLVRLGNASITEFEELADRLVEVPGVLSVSPTVYGQAVLSSDLNRQHGVFLRGVDPARKGILEDLFEQVVEGVSEEFGRLEPLPSMMIGRELAEDLGVLVGDVVEALGREGELAPLGRMPRLQRFRVIAIFESGLWDYDANWALVPIRAAQKFVGLSDAEVSVLEFRIEEVGKAEEVAERIAAEAGVGFRARTWIELNRPLFSALRLEKLALFIAISLIVLVASLNIVGTLTMMVMDKNRDIAIISAMGGNSRTIMTIFLLQGLIIGAAGTVLGAALGCSAVWYFDTYKVFHLEPEVYSIPYVPFEISPGDVVLVCTVALLVTFLATLHPSRTAARLDPMEALRYE